MQLYSVYCMIPLSTVNNFPSSELYSRRSHISIKYTTNELQNKKYGLTHCAVGGCHGDLKILVYISE